MGPIEKKWGVDIELKEADYDTCIIMYGSGKCDAACLTDMDVLNPSLSRHSVAIIPTSTSYGADALIVPKTIAGIKQLRGKNVYGLKKTVSEYCFVRNLEILGENERDHRFTNMDPGAAALAMQQQKKGHDAIVVWNPFVIETLNKRPDTKRLFDSTTIPGEIVDMVQVAQDSLDKPGGKEFACAVIETFYAISKRLDDPITRNNTLTDLGAKFAKLDILSMEKVIDQTRFYATPDAGIKLLEGNEWAMPGHDSKLKGDPFKVIMKRVVSFCTTHDIVPREPKVSYGDKKAAPDADFRVDPTYIRAYLAGPQVQR
jgi:NitT/TauT family transport system substrate-binding protein